MKKKIYAAILFCLASMLCILLSYPTTGAGGTKTPLFFTLISQDSVIPSAIQTDSLKVKASIDSTAQKLGTSVSDSINKTTDSVAVDTTNNSQFNAPIHFEATDSAIVYPKENIAKLYGKGDVKYETKELSADYILLDMNKNTVFASYVERPDSLKGETLYPKYKDGEQDYEAKKMTYNFHTSKGYIEEVVTKQGEGYITAQETKKGKDESMFMRGIRYSTCDYHQNPHFYIAATKAKVRPGKNLISGPAYLVLADVPLPLAVPFGFFPFTKTYSSGIIMPTPGEEYDRGFYLRNGGYYWAISDYIDLEATGDLYTKGSWAANLRSTYRKRYRYSGAFDASYIVTKRGDKVAGDYSKATDFRIAWSHSQDPKANPYRTLSANVNFSTSSYNHNNLDGLYNQAVLGQNTKSSSISFTQRFPNNPITLSGSFDVTQRSQDSTVAITAPNLSITMSRIYPFKRKKAAGKERWYEKIQLSYSGQLRNSITTKENKILKSSFMRDWQHAMEHSVPISASFDLFNYIKISPSIQYKERWYTSKVSKAYDPQASSVITTDTTYGFYRVYDFSTSLSASTTVYGFWKPLPFLGDWVNMIRHRLEPSISFNWKPDFGAPQWGYWERVEYQKKDGSIREEYYSPYDGQLFGVPGRGKFGGLSFNLSQNLEAKIKDKADSTQFKKISLIDNLSTSMSYNMAAEEFKWSDLNASLSLRLPGNINLRLNGVFDTYLYDYEVLDNGNIRPYRVDKLRILNGKGFGRLRSTGTSFSYNINPETFKKIAGLFSRNGKEDVPKDNNKQGNKNTGIGGATSETPPPGSGLGEGSERGSEGSMFAKHENVLGTFDRYGYLKTDIKWNLGFSYSMSLGYGSDFNTETKEYEYKLRHDLSFNGQFNPTKNWNFNFSANYNFDLKRITNMTCNITRDLHCWSMTASFIPLGPYKSYNFTIQVKSSLLQDLRYKQSNTPRRNYDEAWY